MTVSTATVTVTTVPATTTAVPATTLTEPATTTVPATAAADGGGNCKQRPTITALPRAA